MKPLFERILELTGLFETSAMPPNSYGVSVGNFDGAGLSFGVIQFNFKSCTLQPILRQLLKENRPIMERCFGPLLPELEECLATRSTAFQISWGQRRTIKGRPLLPKWRAAFKMLGLTPECQQLQREAAYNQYYAKAVRYFREYGLWSERGLALMFDIAVQNGSISTATKQNIMSSFQAIPRGIPSDAVEVERLRIIANKRAEAANSQWVEDVRQRKLAIANGRGKVHGMAVNLEDFEVRLVRAEV